MSQSDQRCVVVTGVSSGIGLAIVEYLIARRCRVFGSVRREDDGQRLKAEFGANFTPLLFDVLDEESVKNAVKEVEGALNGRTLAALINNAGIGHSAPLALQPCEEFAKIVTTNVVGTMCVTRAFLPLLGTDLSLSGKPGRVINMTSVAGKLTPPFMSAYVASKHAIEGMSGCLRREMLLYGIDVIIVGPGAIKTPIWEKADYDQMREQYASTDYAVPIRKFTEQMLKAGQESVHTPASVAR